MEIVNVPFPRPVIRHLGRVEYEPTWRAMQTFKKLP